MENEYWDDRFDDRCATESEADAEYVRNVGHDSPEREWILSSRDCWYRNPWYTGTPGRHPEDDSDCYMDDLNCDGFESAASDSTEDDFPF